MRKGRHGEGFHVTNVTLKRWWLQTMLQRVINVYTYLLINCTFSLFLSLYRLEWPELKFRSEIFLFSKRPYWLWTSANLLFSGYLDSFPAVRRPWRDVDHSPPPSAEVKNERSYTSTSPPPLCDFMACTQLCHFILQYLFHLRRHWIFLPTLHLQSQV